MHLLRVVNDVLFSLPFKRRSATLFTLLPKAGPHPVGTADPRSITTTGVPSRRHDGATNARTPHTGAGKNRRRRRVHIAELEPLNVPALDGTFTSRSGLVDPRPWPRHADVCQNTTELQKSDGALGPNVQQQLFLAEVAVDFHWGITFS